MIAGDVIVNFIWRAQEAAREMLQTQQRLDELKKKAEELQRSIAQFPGTQIAKQWADQLKVLEAEAKKLGGTLPNAGKAVDAVGDSFEKATTKGITFGS